MNTCRDNHRRNNGGPETWNQMHNNPRFSSNIPRHEFHGYNTRPSNPRQWRTDSSFRGRDQRRMRPPSNRYGGGFNRNNFRPMPFPRPAEFSWNRQNFGNPPNFHPQMHSQNYQEYDQDVAEQHTRKPLEPPYDQNLHDTIDSVKRKLSARQATMTSKQIAPVEDPQSNDADLLKSSEKRRIQHSKILMKPAAVKKSERRPSLSVKSKNSIPSTAPPVPLQIKSQMMRKKILQQLFKMNKNDLQKLLSHPDCANKYDFALQSLIKETRNNLSRQLRAVAEKSLQHYDTSADSLQGKRIMQDAFMGHLGTMLDTDASVELSNLEPQVIAELSKVLQEDLLCSANDDLSVRGFDDDIHPPASEVSIQNIADKQRCFDEARKDDDAFLLHINNEIQSSIFKGNNIFTDFNMKNENMPTKTWQDYLVSQSDESHLDDNVSDNFCEAPENRYSHYNTESMRDEISAGAFVWNDSQKRDYCVNDVPPENNLYSGNMDNDGFSKFSYPTGDFAYSELSNSKARRWHRSVPFSEHQNEYSERHDNAFYQQDNSNYPTYGSVAATDFPMVVNEKSQDSADFRSSSYCDAKIYHDNDFENHFRYREQNKDSPHKSSLRSDSGDMKSSTERFTGNSNQTIKNFDMKEILPVHESNSVCRKSSSSPEMDSISNFSLEILDEQTSAEKDENSASKKPSLETKVENSLKKKVSRNTCTLPQKLLKNTSKKRTLSAENVLSPSNLLSCDIDSQRLENYNKIQSGDGSCQIETIQAKDREKSADVSDSSQLFKSSSCQTVQSVLIPKGTQCDSVGRINTSTQVYESLIHSKSKGTQYNSTSNNKMCSCHNSTSKDYARSRGSSGVSSVKQADRGTQTDSATVLCKSDISADVIGKQEIKTTNKVLQNSQETEANDGMTSTKFPSALEQMKLIDKQIQILVQEKFKLYNKIEKSNTSKIDSKLKKPLGIVSSGSSNNKTPLKVQKPSKVNSQKKISAKEGLPRLSESNNIYSCQTTPKFNKKKIITGADESLYKSKGGKTIKSSAYNTRKRINESQETKDDDSNASSSLCTSTPKSTHRTHSHNSRDRSKANDSITAAQIDDGSLKNEVEKIEISVCDDDYLAAFEDYGDIDNICLETLDFPMTLEGDFVTFDEAFDVKNIHTVTSDGDHSLIKSSIVEIHMQGDDIPENSNAEMQSDAGSNISVSIDLEKSNSNSSASAVQEKTQTQECTSEENDCNSNSNHNKSSTLSTNRINRTNSLGQRKRQLSFASQLETIDCDLQKINVRERKNSGKRNRTSSDSKCNVEDNKLAIDTCSSSDKVYLSNKKHKSDQNDSLKVVNRDISHITNEDKSKAFKRHNTKDATPINKNVSQINNILQQRSATGNRSLLSQNGKNSTIFKSNVLPERKTRSILIRSSDRLPNKSNKRTIKPCDKKVQPKITEKDINKSSPLRCLISQLDDSENESDLDICITDKHASGESVGAASNNFTMRKQFGIKECSVILERISLPHVETAGNNFKDLSTLHANLKDISTIRFKDHDKDFPISIYRVNNGAHESTDELDVSNVIGVIGASDTLDIINNWDSVIFDNVSGCENMEVYANETVIIEEDPVPLPIDATEVSSVEIEDCVENNEGVNTIEIIDNESNDRINFTDHKDSIIAIECVGNKFLAASLDGNVYYYSMNDESLVRTFVLSKLAVTCMCVTKQKSQNVVYAGSLDSYLRCYNIENGNKVIPDVFVGSPIQSMHHSMDTIYVGTRTGIISQFNLQTNTLLPNRAIEFAENAILALHATKEGARKVLLVASRSQKVAVRDANTGSLLRIFNGPDSTIYSLLFHSGTVICGTSGNDIQVFDFVTGEIVAIHNGGNGAVCLKIYKGLLFVGCYDGQIYVFKMSLQKHPIARIPGPGKMLLALAIKDDKIIAGCNDHSLSLWPLPNEVLEYLDSR